MCDTLVSLTGDGVLFAKNSDRDPNEAQALRWYPARDHAPGDEVACTWIRVPQVAHTHAVVLSQPWWMWGAEMGANEHGVVIGNEGVFTRAPDGDPALLGMDLLRLALERASTAADAVEVMVTLLERHGQGGPCSHERPGFTYHNSFLVADPTGAIVLETAGSQWATEVVRSRGRSISNGLTIDGFAEAHAERLKGWVGNGQRRRARTEASAAAADGPLALFAALRDHGADPVPRWSPLNGALAGPCAHAGGHIASIQTTASWVSDLRGGHRHWATATSAPCTSVFLPVRLDEPLPSEPQATNRFDPDVRWWRHERLHRLVLRDHPASTARLADDRDRTERAWVADPPPIAKALAHADELDRQWREDLVTARFRDQRPRWLRRQWATLDREAGIEVLPDRPARGPMGQPAASPASVS
jgi:secernin